jgi:hypothetical protein
MIPGVLRRKPGLRRQRRRAIVSNRLASLSDFTDNFCDAPDNLRRRIGTSSPP